ncbi:MAG: holo-ACP synthase [Candidatus Brockarchaeota archaeon]|nr:holo-ACP synthase [Candidatus Brockarchaeota archaeon]
MPFRIGVDVLSIGKIRSAVERRGDYFLRRAFTQGEILDCSRSSDPCPCLAGKFAAKEAVYKALRSCFELKLRWREIEVVTCGSGPSVKLNGRTAEDSARNGVEEIRVSIAHDLESGTAVAVAILEHRNA